MSESSESSGNVVALPGVSTPLASEPEVVKVGLGVALVPTLVLAPCKCGKTRETTDQKAIDRAMRGETFRASCSCGRIVEAALKNNPVVQVAPESALKRRLKL